VPSFSFSAFQCSSSQRHKSTLTLTRALVTSPVERLPNKSKTSQKQLESLCIQYVPTTTPLNLWGHHSALYLIIGSVHDQNYEGGIFRYPRPTTPGGGISGTTDRGASAGEDRCIHILSKAQDSLFAIMQSFLSYVFQDYTTMWV
jgi:hypothetical protein